MTNGPSWTRQRAAELRDHWWWRPGWKVGTRFYTWHLTFGDAPELHGLVAAYQDALRGMAGLDPVPREWLHLTMQGVGHVEDVPGETVEGIVEGARERLAELPAVRVEFQRPVIGAEAVVLPALPPDAVAQIRTTIRAAMAERIAVPEKAEGFQPHVTVAYSSSEQPAAEVAAALSAVSVAAVDCAISSASLIELHRDRRMYEWRTIAELPIGRA
ncbi:2'-5' RNA ligase family protein [Kribbella sp. NPDC005582]|uniref:2'-5' RNA ligase family protein n=1 Tax=Kribbella sp. NPDC005582 TaxID=3156893 RepID=UPI0033AA76A0